MPADSVMSKIVNLVSTIFIFCTLLSSWTFAQQYVCPICGDGFVVTMPDGIVPFSEATNFTCTQLNDFAVNGIIDETQCAAINLLTAVPCGCEATPTPSATPSEYVTYEPFPFCFRNLDDIMEREIALGEITSRGRTYTLCPNTLFTVGRVTAANQTEYQNGTSPIFPRSNVRYKCGESGSSKNNCIILDGDFLILTTNDDPVLSNVVFEGLTLENGFRGGVLLTKPGDITFIDCIFRNHQNVGTVVILYTPEIPNSRRLEEMNHFFPEIQQGEDEEDDNTEYLPGTHNSIESDGIERLENLDILSSVLGIGRKLQYPTLTVTFRQTLFTGNKESSPSPFIRPGVVTAESVFVELIFEDVKFQNNSFGNLNFQNQSWAIKTSGQLTMQNSCFEYNDFVGEGPVVTLGSPNVDVSNNYVLDTGNNNNLTCSFLADFPDDASFKEGVNITCTEFDATDTCGAKESETIADPTPSPSFAPIITEMPTTSFSPSASPTIANSNPPTILASSNPPTIQPDMQTLMPSVGETLPPTDSATLKYRTGSFMSLTVSIIWSFVVLVVFLW